VKGWTEVFAGPRLQAEIVAAALSAAGIEVSELGGAAQYTGLDFDSCKLFVPNEQAPAAQELIASAERG
jgi:hypothetical protein